MDETYELAYLHDYIEGQRATGMGAVIPEHILDQLATHLTDLLADDDED